MQDIKSSLIDSEENMWDLHKKPTFFDNCTTINASLDIEVIKNLNAVFVMVLHELSAIVWKLINPHTLDSGVNLSIVKLVRNKMSTINFCFKIPDRRRAEELAWCETSRWDIHARGNKGGESVPYMSICLWEAFTGILIFIKLRSDIVIVLFLYFFYFFVNLKASAQIQAQTTKSSSIILALTDGKLEVYVHELTVKEVRFTLIYCQKAWFIFILVLFTILFSTCCVICTPVLLAGS